MCHEYQISWFCLVRSLCARSLRLGTLPPCVLVLLSRTVIARRWESATSCRGSSCEELRDIACLWVHDRGGTGGSSVRSTLCGLHMPAMTVDL
mmetsp:Transcript_24193/g.70913  ORF Transcript_24193/g.70913 Transcript_24193/m.70913 type:complete len:93 (+) Transcript_24193:2580-2858(+)